VIKKRLRFVRDALLDDPEDIPEHVMAARLEALGLLTTDEAQTIGAILGDMHEQIDEWSLRRATRSSTRPGTSALVWQRRFSTGRCRFV
jgi:hypothetical protein